MSPASTADLNIWYLAKWQEISKIEIKYERTMITFLEYNLSHC